MKKPSEHIVLARKYRPQGFTELLGQPSVSVTLKNALSSGRMHHAYLFTGPRGVGKTTMARILAKALNCKKGPTPEPCGECDSCREIASSSSLDVLEMDAASHTGVDNVRQVIIDTVALAPSRDRYKIFIVDEAHMLSTAAFNALLKTLEEPPPHVVFILATTESAKVPATIASRCQRFKFRPVPVEMLAAHLANLAKKEKLDAEPAALELLARSADGSLRDAVSLLDQCRSAGGDKVTEELVRDMFGFVPQDMLLGVAQSMLAKDAPALAQWLKKLHAEGVEPAQLLRDLRSACESLYLEKLGAAEPSPDKALRALSAQGTADQFSFLLRRLNKTLEELRFGDSPRLILELGLFSCLEAAGDLEVWVKRLEELERRLASGEPASIQSPRAPAPQPAAVSSFKAPPQQSVKPSSPPAQDGPDDETYDSEEEPASPAIAGSPAPAPAPAGSPAQAWRLTIEAVRLEKSALASSLEKAGLASSDGPLWKLTFARTFDLDQAKRGQALIEAKLATAAGRSIKLSFEAGAGGPAGPTEVSQPSVSSTPGGELGNWKDAAEPGAAKPEGAAGASKAQQILGGKMRIIKKPTS